MARSTRRGLADEAGVTTLAAVVVLPAVILIVSAVAQFGVYYHAANLATAAARVVTPASSASPRRVERAIAL